MDTATSTGINRHGQPCHRCNLLRRPCGLCKGSRPTAGAGGATLDAAAAADTSPQTLATAPPTMRPNQTLELTVTDDQLERLTARVERRNADAARIGFGGYDLEIIGDTDSTIEGPDGDYPITVTKVRVTGAPVKLPEGGTIRGVVQQLGDGGEGVLVLADDDLGENLDPHDVDFARCDQCGLKRRRNKLLVLETPDGVKLVGGECARRYVGDGGIDGLLSALADMPDLDPGSAPGWDTPAIPTLDVVATAVAAVEEYSDGRWVPRDADRQTPTTDHVRSALQTGALEPSDAQRARAAEIIARYSDTNDPDLDPDMAAVLAASKVSIRHLNRAAAVVAFDNRRLADLEWAAAKERQRAASTYQGEIGEKLTRDLTVTSTSWHSGYQGRGTTLVLMTDDDGNVFKCWTSGQFSRDVAEGDTVTVAAKVKAHEEYDGLAQTVLVGPKMVENPAASTRATTESIEAALDNGNRAELNAWLNDDNFVDGVITDVQVLRALNCTWNDVSDKAAVLWRAMPEAAKEAAREGYVAWRDGA